MKNRITQVVFLLFFGWMMVYGITSSSGKSGKTGAPGENTCVQCHAGVINSNGGSVTISGISNNSYQPGQVYTLSVTITDAASSLFGFSAVALQASGANAGTLVAGTDNHTESLNVGGFLRNYVTHNTDGGATAGSHTFVFSWTAPATDIGNITIYVTANAADGNGGTTGDHIYSTSLTLSPQQIGGGEVVINEVDADQPQVDNAEFIELYGTPGMSLNGHTIVLFNGNNDVSYAAYDLTGYSLNQFGYFVLGSVSNANLFISSSGSGFLHNGADAVALFQASATDWPIGTPVSNAGLVDALVYGTTDAQDAELIAALAPTQSQVDEGVGNNTNSMSRVPNGGTALDFTTFVAQAPSPGASNLGSVQGDEPWSAFTPDAVTGCISRTLTPSEFTPSAIPGAPGCAGNTIAAQKSDAWLLINVPSTGILLLNPQGTGDTGMAAYTYDPTTGAFTLIGCDDDSGPGLIPQLNITTLAPGTPVYVRVWAYTSAGTLSFNICSCSNFVTPSVTITSNDADNSICSGSSVTFTATPVNGGNAPTYQWQVNGVDVPGETGISYTANVLLDGDVVAVVMTANNACQTVATATSNSITTVVTNSVTPAVSITSNDSDNSICQGANIIFTASTTTGGTAPAYQWMINGAAITGATSSTFATNSLTNGQIVTVEMTPNNVCQSASLVTSNAIAVTITDYVVPTLTIAADANGVCAGTAINFSSSAVNPGPSASYQWKVNGVAVPGATGASYSSNTLANNDVVTLTMTPNNACQTLNSVTSSGITMNIIPNVTPSVSITESVNNICPNTSVTFVANPTIGGTNPTYQWLIGGVPVIGETAQSFVTSTLTNGNQVTVQMTVNNLCQSSSTVGSNTIVMTVNPNVVPEVVIVATQTSICSGSSVTFTATPVNGGNAPSYQWKRNGNNVGANSATYTSTTLSNNDVVSVVMTANNACQTSSTATSNGIAMNVVSSNNYYADTDGDGFGNAAEMISTCNAPAGYVADNSDCNDALANVYPGAQEICGNEIDEDCNGTDQPCATILGCTNSSACNFNPLANFNDGSCIFPIAETCNGLDDNCNGEVDELVLTVYFADNDGDGFGDANNITFSCSLPSGYVTNFVDCDDSMVTYEDLDADGFGGVIIDPCGVMSSVDCNDTDPSIGFSTAEICGNGIDEDCSGADLQCAGILGCTDLSACNYDPLANQDNGSCTYSVTYYGDNDGDGFGNINTPLDACSQPTGFVLDNADCDDANASINPISNEICDNLDNNCDGSIDEDLGVVQFADNDGDGFGNPNSPSESCFVLVGYVENSDDCNDTNASINLGSNELCDGIDNNCDGNADEGLIFSDYFSDVDGDGYGADLIGNLCQNPGGNATILGGDCNDNNASINPAAIEGCNQIDDNCNGQVDEGLTIGAVNAVVANSAIYPTCTTGSMFSANLNNGVNTAVIAGDGADLWYRFTAQTNAFRASLSAATGNNALYLYQNVGGCFTMLAQENETVNNLGQPLSNGNQILLTSNLVVGNEYYVAVHNNSGSMNASAKICFNHFVGTTCDHTYSNNTGIYTSVCSSFKAQYKANASQYIFNVLSGSQGGNNMNITPWFYATPTSSSIITRLGTLLPANMDVTPKIYTLSVGVIYAMYDAGNNLTPVTANSSVTCTAQLNQEQAVVLRNSDRCPLFKTVTSSVATNRQICGASRYEWEFTQVGPTAQAPVVLLGGLGTNVFFLNTVPGMSNGKTYSVRVRPLFTNGPAGEYGASNCMKTTGAGMVMEENNDEVLAQLTDGTQLMTVYPNPSSTGEIVLQWSQVLESDLKVKMYNAIGELVFQQTFFQEGANSLPIQLSNVSSGMYLMEVELNGKSETHRVMINR